MEKKSRCIKYAKKIKGLKLFKDKLDLKVKIRKIENITEFDVGNMKIKIPSGSRYFKKYRNVILNSKGACSQHFKKKAKK